MFFTSCVSFVSNTFEQQAAHYLIPFEKSVTSVFSQNLLQRGMKDIFLAILGKHDDPNKFFFFCTKRFIFLVDKGGLKCLNGSRMKCITAMESPFALAALQDGPHESQLYITWPGKQSGS